MSTHRLRRRAFGLAELLVSLGVVVPVAMVAVGIFPFGWLVNQQSICLDAAHDVARSQLEATRTIDFDSIPASQSGCVRDPRGTDYNYTVVAASYGPVTNPLMRKQITVTVTWNDRKPEQLQLITILVRTATTLP
jgi:hypothetical protein